MRAILILGVMLMPNPANAQQRWLEEMQALSAAVQQQPQGRPAPGAMQMPPEAATGGGPPTFGPSPLLRAENFDPYQPVEELRPTPPISRQMEEELDRINDRRATIGLPPLTPEQFQQQRARMRGR